VPTLFKLSVRLKCGPKRAAHAADQGVTAAACKAGGGGHANARRLACRADNHGPQDTPDGGNQRMAVPGGPTGAAWVHAPGRGTRVRPVVSCGYCASGGGAPAPGWLRTPSPSPRAEPSRPRRGPPAWLPTVTVRTEWRAPAGARSHGGRVEGDGMLLAQSAGIGLTATGVDDDGQGDAAMDGLPRSQPQTDGAGRRAQNLQARDRSSEATR
jgi:hypothetical protein